ncbi:MAG: hypothetical protein QOG62_743 [Thermoleophilaceae bacterium]|nr:hypothetical protein [Thermoleophilaceae bacterium]
MGGCSWRGDGARIAIVPEITPALFRAGEGEQVVLLHGFSGTWRHWLPVLAELTAHYEVIAPTAAGHFGGPPVPPDMDFTLEGAADQFEDHLDQLGVERAHFVGNSMGGGISIELAKRGRAISVVALAPAGGWDPAGKEAKRLNRFFNVQYKMAVAARPRMRRLLKSPGFRKQSMRAVMCHGDLVHPDEALAMVDAMLACTVFDAAISNLKANKAHLTNLDQVAAPVLLAWPEKDKVLPISRYSQRFRNEIPGAEFKVLEGTGHVPMWDDPRTVIDTITGWVDRHSAARPVASLSR